MALVITEDCISCGACETECPVNAISPGDDKYEINPNTCVECVGHYDSPQCQSECPTECIVKP